MKVLTALLLVLSALSVRATDLVDDYAYQEDPMYDRANCKKGKPCGNSCININYTCHIGTTPTVTTPIVTTPVITTPVITTPVVSTPVVPTYTYTIPEGGAVKPVAGACESVTLVRVIDGDTIVVNGSHTGEHVRIDQIDAPERSQAYGLQATSCLGNILAQGAPLQVCRDGSDRYGRTIAKVVAGSDQVAEEMVSQGCAWAYTKYLEANSPLPSLEAAARSAKLGLWADSTSIAPWLYRGGTVPVTATAPVVVSTETVAQTHDRIFDWVEHKFSDLTTEGTETQSVLTDGRYRCYSSNLCIGTLGGRVYLRNPAGEWSDIGSVDSFLAGASSDGY